MDNIVIRSDMKTDSEVMGALNIGETVEVVETKFDWHKIKFGNGYAYVSAVYVK